MIPYDFHISGQMPKTNAPQMAEPITVPKYFMRVPFTSEVGSLVRLFAPVLCRRTLRDREHGLHGFASDSTEYSLD